MKQDEFIDLVTSHQHTIAKVYNRYCKGFAISKEDLFQEIMLETWKSIKNFKNNCTFNTWLYNISRNVCVSAIRKLNCRARTEHLSTTCDELLAANEDDSIAKQIEQAMRYNVVIDSIEQPYRDLFIMYIEGATYQEMSEQTGITENALRGKICHIKKRLRLRYGK